MLEIQHKLSQACFCGCQLAARVPLALTQYRDEARRIIVLDSREGHMVGEIAVANKRVGKIPYKADEKVFASKPYI
jgi:hypothetical protein